MTTPQSAIDNWGRTGASLDHHDRAELEAHRDGIGHLAEDPIHASQPVHEVWSYSDAESTWWLQITHADQPLWNCMACGKLTLGPANGGRPQQCMGCDEHPDGLTPLLYPEPSACRSWAVPHGGGYTGRCLIAGSDGCECEENR